MLAFVLFAVILVAFLVGSVIYLYPGLSRVTTVPGPDPSDKKDGNIPDILEAGGLPLFLRKLHEEYGTVVSFWYGQKLAVSFSSADHLATQAGLFDKPPLLYEHLRPILGGRSLLFQNGVEAHRSRKLYEKSFTEQACSSYFSNISKISLSLVNQWTKKSAHQHVELQRYMMAFSVKVVLQSCFGEYFHHDDNVLNVAHQYEALMNEVDARLSAPPPENTDPRELRFHKLISDLRSSVTEMVAYTKEHSTASLLIDTMLTNGEDEDVIDNVLTFIVQGFHTLRDFATWVLYYVARYEDIQNKLVEEAEDLGELTPDNITTFKFMRQVLDESLRCAAVCPYTSRVSERELIVEEHVIPKNTLIFHALGEVMRQSEFWRNPEKFEPKRFAAENVKAQHPAAFCPFGYSGKRICPAMRLSYSAVTILVVHVLRKFKLHLADIDAVRQPSYGYITKPEEEIWITMECRS